MAAFTQPAHFKVTLVNTRITFVEVFSFQRRHTHFSVLFNLSIYKFTALNKVYEHLSSNQQASQCGRSNRFFFYKPNVG